MNPRHMKWKVKNGNWKKIFIAGAMLLIGSGVAQAQVKVRGNIYGGGEAALVTGNDTVKIHGTENDTIVGSVFGGGEGAAATVTGYTYVSVSNGIVINNVYGGGMDASVDHNTYVSISGGQIGLEQVGQASVVGGNVFGGGLGRPGGIAAFDYGNVDSTRVDVSGDAYIIGSVFGGGDDGHVLGSTNIVMTGGVVGKPMTVAEYVTDSLEHAATHIYIGNVLAGGRGLGTVNGQFNDTTGRVFGNAHVTISGGVVRHGVYGGGGLSSIGLYETDDYGNITRFITRNGKETGKTYVTINGDAVIGPSREDLESFSQADRDTIFKYLGDNEGWVFGAGCGLAGGSDQYYHKLTFNDSAFVQVSGDAEIVGAVYGGGENGHVLTYTDVNISGGTIGGLPMHDGGAYPIPSGLYKDLVANLDAKDSEIYEDEYGVGHNIYRGEVYGGGKGTDTITDGVDKGKYSITAGRVFGNTNVTISDSALIYHRVYGGGSLASVGDFEYYETYPSTNIALGDKIQRIRYISGGTSKVTVSGGTIGTDGRNNGDVVGGGRGLVGNPNGFDILVNATDGADQVVRLAYVDSTSVTINEGAHIKSNVYGGSLNGHVYGNTLVTVNGGTIGDTVQNGTGYKVRGGWHSNVFGGGGGVGRYVMANGNKHLSITSGRVYGNTKVEIKGGRVLNSVYGGGPIASVGTYDLREGVVPLVENTGATEVVIANGTIGYDGDGNGDVFGSGLGIFCNSGAYPDSLSYAGTTTVKIGKDGETEGPMVKGSVYGSGENGHVFQNTYVYMYGGTVCNNVFGAGSGSETDASGQYNPIGGIVIGNTNITMYGGLVKHNVYGGGQIASVGMKNFSGASTQGTGIAKVIVSGGQVGDEHDSQGRPKGNVFGGGYGALGSTQERDLAIVDSTRVEVSGDAYIVNSVYGGAENGSVERNTDVAISGGTIGRVLTLDERKYKANGDHTFVYSGNVYAGGRGSERIAANEFSPIAGRVYGNTNVTVSDSALIRHNVYGGGALASVGDFTIASDTVSSYISGGKATVTISGGIIGPKLNDLIKDASGNALAQIMIDSAFLYLGNNEGNVYGSSRGEPGLDYRTKGFVKETVVTISGNAQVVGSVFGGAENGSVFAKTEVNINGGTIGGAPFHEGQNYTIPEGLYAGQTVNLDDQDSEIAEDEFGVGRQVLRGMVFGGGRGSDTYNGLYNYTAGRVYGNTKVTVSGGTIYNNVYGGGTIASVGRFKYDGTVTDSIVRVLPETGKAEVFITGGQIGTDGNNNGNVYGGGLGMAAAPKHQLTYLAYVGSTDVRVSQASKSVPTRIKNSVYGGAASGHVQTNTKVTISGGTIGDTIVTPKGTKVHGGWHSNVYGGGGGTTRYDIPNTNKKRLSISSGRVFGDTEVTIEDSATIYHNVYGGGAIASVGTYDLSGNGVPYAGYDNGGYGKSVVKVKGGTIGYDGSNNGMVYGSGRGQIDTIGAFLDSLSYSAYTEVYIGQAGTDGPKVKGSVYGAGENGHVYMKATVNVNSGVIGCDTAEFRKVISVSDSLMAHNFPFRGNVYGAGCGTDTMPDGNYNPIAGIVQGETEVNINGGYISRSVYGAGAMASVGFVDASKTVKHTNTGSQAAISWPYELTFFDISDHSGRAKVNIKGGHIGTVGASDVSGNVYGSARGEAGDRYKFGTLANAKETEVVVNFIPNLANPVHDSTANVIVGSVYGSGDNGHVYENTYDTIVNGLIMGSVFGGGKGTDLYLDTLWIVDGNGGHTLKRDTLVHSITAGKVYGNTYVIVNGGVIKDNVYGGGNMASVGKGNYSGYGESGTAADGRTYVKVNGGTIGTTDIANWDDNGHVFGGSKGTAFVNVTARPRFNYSHEFFLGYINYSYVTIGDGTNSPTIYGSVFGGGEDGHVRYNTDVTVNSGEIGLSYDTALYKPILPITANQWKLRGNVYGAGRGIDTIPNTTDLCYSAGSVTDSTHVTINGGLIHRHVYGGGSLATVGPPHGYTGNSINIVDILGGTIGDSTSVAHQYGGDVFGSSRGEIAAVDNQQDTLAYAYETKVNIGKKVGSTLSGNALVQGSVYGSGENGHVTTDATVNIYKGRIGDAKAQVMNTYCGNVYGGGSGTDTLQDGTYNPYAGLVKGNTHVNIEGGWVMRSVYGGGEIASVGTIESIHKHESDHPFNISWPYYMRFAQNTGKATVNVKGGRIGITGKDGITEDDRVDNGDIYGGGKGTVGNRYQVAQLANVDTAVVVINYANLEVNPTNYKDHPENQKGCITGAVYGGGENGHVNHDTHITFTKGLIGHAIYGGGKGKDKYETVVHNTTTGLDETVKQYDVIAGKVYGNTYIDINAADNEDAYVVRSVFGGGNLASVGVGNYAGGVDDYNSSTGYGELVTNGDNWSDTTNTGHTYVNIFGGTLGMLNPDKPHKVFKDTIPYGSVFGGCRGLAVRDLAMDEIDDIFGKRPDLFLGFVNHTHVTIGDPNDNSSDPRLYGSVFGGAQDGHVRWNTNVTVNNGTLGVQFGVDVVANTASINEDPNNPNWTERGNVYGGGSGVGLYDEDTPGTYSSQAGSVTQKTNVTINGGKVHRNVYGGGNLATVGPPRFGSHDCPSDSTGVLVNINAPVGHSNEDYGGRVYGGSRGLPNPDNVAVHQFKKFALVSYTTVNINDGADVANAVFGGGENGQVGIDGDQVELIHNTEVNIFGGNVEHTVYGGGEGMFGEDNYKKDTISGFIMGSSRVNLLAGTVNNVFGGGRNAIIGDSAIVNVGLPDMGTYTGTTFTGNVYGANNHNGTPLGDVVVNVYQTAHTYANTYPSLSSGLTWTTELLHANAQSQGYAINNVFGGGNQSDYTPGAPLYQSSGKGTPTPKSATVHVFNCDNTIREVYGGANQSKIGTPSVNTDTYVIIEGGRIHHVYGGGKGDNANNISSDINGTANTEIKGGLIDAIFGGGNQLGSILATNLVINTESGSCSDILLDSIFGGSNQAPINGNVTTTIACSDKKYENIYGGANEANITGNVTLNVLGSTITNAFGGSKGSLSTPANINGNVTLNLYGGTITNAFGGSDMNGNITGVVTVNVLDTVSGCPLDLTNVYGGSQTATLTLSNLDTVSPVVNVVHGIVKGNVFGGSLGATAVTTSNPQVNIGYDPTYMSNASLDTALKHLPAGLTVGTMVDTVKGNVYGGGSLADLIGNTTVNINKGVVGDITYAKTAGSSVYDTIIHASNSGRVFGGGRGKDEVIALDDTVAMVYGDTRVNIRGGQVLYSVYGGGELSSVGDSAFVTVTGGQVGPAPKVETGYNIPIGLSGIDGYVFGGGKGVGNDPMSQGNTAGSYYKYANVNNTLVTVNIPADADTTLNRLWGSIFGGAEDGHVLGNTNVRYISGVMGTTGTTSYDGNIFGGGRNYSKKNYTAGRVGGNINVEMSGGQLFGNIFGGGRLALTGIDESGQIQDGVDHGNTKIVVKGGKVGNERLIEHWTASSMGDVFGGGKGSMKGLEGHDPASAMLISLTKNTEVIIKDSISSDGTTIVSSPIIYGSVFGGGEVANVGSYTWSTDPSTGAISNIQPVAGTGLAKVTVSGGRIGLDKMRMSYDTTENTDVGHVFGGGEGIVMDTALSPTVDGGQYKLVDLMATVLSTEVTIKDSAWVKGSVYGGAENGHVWYDTWVKVQGGQIGSGEMAVERKYTEEEFLTAESLPECPHWPYGDTINNIIQFNPHDVLLVANGVYPSDGHTFFGNVFGGGSGYYPYFVTTTQGADSAVWSKNAGTVGGSTKVEISGGHILTSVYGGCETNDVLGDSAVVIMSGGTLGVPRTMTQIARHPVTCYLFGSGKGDPRTNFNTYTNVNNVRVQVSDSAWIYGSVFGGGEEGHVLNNVVVNVMDTAKIGTHGYSYVDGNVFGAGRGFTGEALTAGTVGGNVTLNIKGGKMLGSIYGGGRLASVGIDFVYPGDPGYGVLQDGPDHGYVTINISGGTIGNDQESTLTHTKGGNVFGGSMGRLEKLDGSNNPIWPSLAKVKQTRINISGDAVIKSNVYGGAELGSVRDSSIVAISGGIVKRDVYGGGYGSDKFSSIDNDSSAYPMQLAGRVEGNTLVMLSDTGWVMKSIYGGGELASVGRIIDSIKHPETGSGSTFNLSWPYKLFYANGTGNANIKVVGGRVGITGKDKMGNKDANNKEIKEDNGDIYGGGKGLAGDRYLMAHCANVNRTLVNIKYNNLTVTPANYKDQPDGNKGCIAGAVYGGGENGHVIDSTSITLTKGLIGHAMYGGGKGKDQYYQLKAGSTTEYDTLYSRTAGKVYGNTHITINAADKGDAYVVRSVYGGGNLASVGVGNYAGGLGDYNPDGYGEKVTDLAQWADTANTGHTYVNIYGGTLGMLPTDPTKPDDVFKDNIPYGSVFGGSRGQACPGEWDSLGFVNHTHVTIGKTGEDRLRLYGSVYGGAQDGHVRWDANTVVNSGEIGVNWGGSETNQVGSTDSTSMYWVARGNVFGAGSGIGTYETYKLKTGSTNEYDTIDNLSHIAGTVLQKVNVTINGGTIHRNVYGGGNLATVGPPRANNVSYDCPDTLTGVTVNINAVIGQNDKPGYGGNIFGGSKGRANLDSIGTGGTPVDYDEYEDFAYCSYTTVNLNNGADVKNDVFGGAENGQVGTPHVGDTTHFTVINVNNGAIVQGSVLGGGQGSWGLPNYLYDTLSGRVMGNTYVNVNANATVHGNVYGGGALGIVMDTAFVNINGARVNDVFGAGRGYETKLIRANADVFKATQVNVYDGSVINGSVYGGGENGTLGFLAPVNTPVTATVNLNGGSVAENAFGGGQLGYTKGCTFVNVSGTALVNESVYGGAYGRVDTVFVTGLRTVNMRGGRVLGSVYGGSFKADDALDAFHIYDSATFANYDQTRAQACVVNYSGGETEHHVFASGYFGRTYGSVYAFIGTRAIMNAPNHTANNDPDYLYNESFFNAHENLLIGRSVWGGADYGNLESASDVFGPATISGRSDIYVDGNGYDTQNEGIASGQKDFMRIGESLFGCGTRNDGGRHGKRIMVRDYGYDVARATVNDDVEPWVRATRTLKSIQCADSLIVESSHILLEGQGLVNEFNTTAEYAIYTISEQVRVVNGGSLYINKPVRNIGSLHSNYVANASDMYSNAPHYVPVNYDELDDTQAVKDNKIRINQGSNVTVIKQVYVNSEEKWLYGELSGYFYLMTDGDYNAFAYARPKNSLDTGNSISGLYDNEDDGGFVNYRDTLNIYDINGATGGDSIQMPYKNYTPSQNRNGEDYFRVWRYLNDLGISVFDIVLHAVSNPSGPNHGFTYYSDVLSLLPQMESGSFYRIKRTDATNHVPEINYGSEIRMVNAGYQAISDTTKWMYHHNENNLNHFVYAVGINDSTLHNGQAMMTNHPNNAFGLTVIPEGGFAYQGGFKNQPWLICPEANSTLGDDKTMWYNYGQQTSTVPQIRFVLTHSNDINGNFEWDPLSITMEQVSKEGTVIDEIQIHVKIVTETSIEQVNNANTYAMMVHAPGNGNPRDVYSAKVVLPHYQLALGGLSEWTLKEVKWHPAQTWFQDALEEGDHYLDHHPDTGFVSMTMYPTRNFDNLNGWYNNPDSIAHIDLKTKLTPEGGSNPIITPIFLGKTDGAQPISFNFDLHYDSDQNIGREGNAFMGTVEVTAHFTNYNNAEGMDSKFYINIYRRGKGRAYYIDGVYGDFAYSGQFPNAAQPSVAGIFYFSDPPFEPVDTIYVVNKMTANSVNTLTWDGSLYEQLKIYRYNGGHERYSGEDPCYTNYNTTYPGNPAYKGALVDVRSKMKIKSTIIDGSYLKAEMHSTKQDSVVDADHLVSKAPLFEIHNGGQLCVIGGDNTASILRNNYNASTNGGAVNVLLGGEIMMNENTIVENNYVKDSADDKQHHGGGVFMAENAQMLLSDSVMIYTNKHVTADNEWKFENVYLDDYNTVIKVGTNLSTDNYGPLNPGSKVGVTKIDWRDKAYMPVVYTENVHHYTNLLGDNIIYDENEPHTYRLYEYPYRYPNDDVYYLKKLYFVRTWTDVVVKEPDTYNPTRISTPEELAWAISVVNGLNNVPPEAYSSFNIINDIDMSKYFWVPIGDTTHKYVGVFEGNGFLVSGINSSLPVYDKGMFGVTGDKAVIRNLQVIVDFHKGNASNLGGVVGHMRAGGELYNVESAGYLESPGLGNGSTVGGLVGALESGAVVHSSFATDTLSGSKAGMSVGGLVGQNIGDLYNSYSFFNIDTAYNKTDVVGGLAGVNAGRIENCYVHDVGNARSADEFGWLASENANTGRIRYSYIPQDSTPYVKTNNGTLVGYGTYDTIRDRKALGYMYFDNKVKLAPSLTNHVDSLYYVDSLGYAKGSIAQWPGMLSYLNRWVDTVRTKQGSYPMDVTHLSHWFRPTTANINGDLPILAFPMDSVVATYDHDSLFLKYSSSIDSLLLGYASDTSSIFLYGTATKVQYVPNDMEKVFINEDAVLLRHKDATGEFGNTTVGVTFDNSSKKGKDYYGNRLEYDWHLMSTPLKNAKMGTVYGKFGSDPDGLVDASGNYTYDAVSTYQESPVDIISMVDSYFPNGLEMGANLTDTVKWDFYSYFEPEYHWINLKRNKNNHFHRDAHENLLNPNLDGRPAQPDVNNGYPHYQIHYNGDYSNSVTTEMSQALETITADQAANQADDATRMFIPGKGYMMAISKDSYMSSTGILNDSVVIPITSMAYTDYIQNTSTDKGSNLVGNPYQAYLNLDTVSNQYHNTGFDKFWIYDADSEVDSTSSYGLYKPYIKSASVNPAIPSPYIHPHQAFFVVYQQSGLALQNMTFKPYMATTKKTEYSHFRDGSQPAYPLVNLYMSDSEGNTDLTIVEVNRPEVGGVPKIDNLRNADFTMYAKMEGENYGLLFAPEGTERVPVFFKTPYNDTYTLSWKQHNGTFATMRLIDNITGTDYDMLTHDHYTFEGRASDFAARFYIVFTMPAPDNPDPEDPDEPGNADEDEPFAFFNGIGWVINGTGQLELVDMLGQVLYANHIDGNPTMVHFDDFAAGTYMLRLVNSNKILKTQKIVIY